MKKIKTTKTNIMKNYEYVISVGYCQLQSLLRFHEPQAYTCSAYGCITDVYEIAEVGSNIAIVTGYRPFGNVQPSYELNKKYESIAKLYAKSIRDAEERRLIFNWLINKYVDEVLKSEDK